MEKHLTIFWEINRSKNNNYYSIVIILIHLQSLVCANPFLIVGINRPRMVGSTGLAFSVFVAMPRNLKMDHDHHSRDVILCVSTSSSYKISRTKSSQVKSSRNKTTIDGLLQWIHWQDSMPLFRDRLLRTKRMSLMWPLSGTTYSTSIPSDRSWTLPRDVLREFVVWRDGKDLVSNIVFIFIVVTFRVLFCCCLNRNDCVTVLTYNNYFNLFHCYLPDN